MRSDSSKCNDQTGLDKAENGALSLPRDLKLPCNDLTVPEDA